MSRTRDVKVCLRVGNLYQSHEEPDDSPHSMHQFLLLVGLIIRLAGVAFMIRSRGANGTPIELILNQALQGIGGGFASVTLQVSAQAGVSHAEVATVIAMVMLITEVGNSVGSASTSPASQTSGHVSLHSVSYLQSQQAYTLERCPKPSHAMFLATMPRSRQSSISRLLLRGNSRNTARYGTPWSSRIATLCFDNSWSRPRWPCYLPSFAITSRNKTGWRMFRTWRIEEIWQGTERTNRKMV